MNAKQWYQRRVHGILFHSIPKTANMSWFITSKLMDASDRSNLKIVVMLTDLKPVLTDLMSNDKLLSLGKLTEIIIQKMKKLDSVRDDDEKNYPSFMTSCKELFPVQ
eukprot:TRINITY_DN4541_c0_g1_i1.p1 TRINITY_DN4541_c0_g1~~TRINITY_DN4541_c0_g1_i1.p1  ORF type:complete len:107 (-),score=5.30 TRINITY_DN4541_c0_g1_i1:117-437(-)